MIAAIHNDWSEANQRYLVAALARIREALRKHSAHGSGPSLVGEEETPWSASAPPALDRLCATFGLSPFERDVLLLCAGMELDAAFIALCADAQGDGRRTYPTFSLALAAFAEAHWSALLPDAPLRYWRLLELGTGDSLVAVPLRIDERILHYLTGVSYLDERLRGLMEPLADSLELSVPHRAVTQRITAVWSRRDTTGAWPVVVLCGAEPEIRRAIAAAASAQLGAHLYACSAADISAVNTDREALLRLWEREAVLTGSALLLETDDLETADNQRALRRWIDQLHGIVIVSGRDPVRELRRAAIRLDVPALGTGERRVMWRAVLGPVATGLNGQLDAAVQQFRLSPSALRAATLEVASTPPGDGRSLWDVCRAQARPRLDDLAQRIDPAATWADLVVPEPQRQVLREIALQVRVRGVVYDQWGFAARSARGLGISALFAGTSGTGKTMAAEVLAQELRLDLYRIDLSQVVSKYIGETEKNLRRVFDAAEAGGAILLFDEADALFGKRSEVKDSHDRYANIEISYLLQRMEAYGGLAILTTNMKSALDPAFLRRLRFVVEFPFPDVAQRAEIWRKVFPTATPTEQLDFERLARLSIPGGNIRNIALHGAFLAADGGEPVRMRHLLQAARREYAKMERPLSDAEIGGWA